MVTATSPSVRETRGARTRRGRAEHVQAGVLRLAHPLLLEHGGGLEQCHIAYEVLGRPGLPIVVVLGGISAGRHLAAHRHNAEVGWWQDQVGDERAIDTTRFCALGIDWLGGAGASSRPARRLRPDTSAALRDARTTGASAPDPPFPLVSTRDQARAIAAVLDHLGVASVQAIVGASYGGMVALAFAELFPGRVDCAVVLSAAHCSHPMATALRSLQRRVVRLGIESDNPTEALRIARGLAMTSYRTAEEFAERFTQEPRLDADGIRFPVEDYLEYCGVRFAEVFPPEAFLRLSESIDLHRVDPGKINVPTTLVVVKSDALVPPWQMRELARCLEGPVTLVEIESIYGHDAFLKEETLVAEVLEDALESSSQVGVRSWSAGGTP